ncbi:MAG: hypothetical protein FCKEOINB_01790 [Nitrosomonas sp.]|nr:hypothetical protein [Nitrosomonas sp.]
MTNTCTGNATLPRTRFLRSNSGAASLPLCQEPRFLPCRHPDPLSRTLVKDLMATLSKGSFPLFLKECGFRFNYGSPKQQLKILKLWTQI